MKLAILVPLRALLVAALVFGRDVNQQLAAAPDDKTITLSEADLRLAAILKIEPDYPAVARQIRLTGSVELEILIDETGAVEKANVIRGNTLLTGPSLQAIRKWKFKPLGSKAAGPVRFSFQM